MFNFNIDNAIEFTGNLNRKIRNGFDVFVIKKQIKNPAYRIKRLREMSDEIINWNSIERNSATFGFEKDYCKKMQEIFAKRFEWYKDKYMIKNYVKI